MLEAREGCFGKKKKKSTVVYLRISQMRQSIPSQLSGNYEAKARWWLA